MTAFEDTGALAADLLACLDDPLLSRRICDVHFVLQPVEDSGNDSACANGSDDECVDGLCPPPLCVPAISAVVAARSPGLRSLLGGDLRAGWVGLAALPTTGGPGASELPIDMPGTPFSASGVEAVRGREREDTPRTLLPLPGPDWGPAEFNMMIRHLHGAPALFTSNETGDKTALHLALCADHFGVFALRDAAASWVADKFANPPPPMQSEVQILGQIHGKEDAAERGTGESLFGSSCEVLQRVAGRPGFESVAEAVLDYILAKPSSCLGATGDHVLLSEALMATVAADDRLAMTEPALFACLMQWGERRIAVLRPPPSKSAGTIDGYCDSAPNTDNILPSVLAKLVGHVRFGLCPPDWIVDVAMPSGVVPPELLVGALGYQRGVSSCRKASRSQNGDGSERRLDARKPVGGAALHGIEMLGFPRGGHSAAGDTANTLNWVGDTDSASTPRTYRPVPIAD